VKWIYKFVSPFFVCKCPDQSSHSVLANTLHFSDQRSSSLSFHYAIRMAFPIARSTLLSTSRVWPTWLPEALVETHRQSLISQLQPVTRQLPSFQFSACLQSLFSLQDSILGISNPTNFQARAFSQQTVARRRVSSLQTASPSNCSSHNRLEHTAARQTRVLSAPHTLHKARFERYNVMKSRILSVL